MPVVQKYAMDVCSSKSKLYRVLLLEMLKSTYRATFQKKHDSLYHRDSIDRCRRTLRIILSNSNRELGIRWTGFMAVASWLCLPCPVDSNSNVVLSLVFWLLRTEKKSYYLIARFHSKSHGGGQLDIRFQSSRNKGRTLFTISFVRIQST